MATKTQDTTGGQAVKSSETTLTPAQIATRALVTSQASGTIQAARALGQQMNAVRAQAVTDAQAMLDAGPDAVQQAIMLVHGLCAAGADPRQLDAIVIVEHVAALVETWRGAKSRIPSIIDVDSKEHAALIDAAAHAALDVQAELYYLARRMPRSVRNAEDVTETLRGLAKMLDAVSRAPVMARPRAADYSAQYAALAQRQHDATLRRLKAQGKLPGQVKPRDKASKATIDADNAPVVA